MVADGVALAARFSLATSRREFCGPTGAAESLFATAVSGARSGESRSALLRFEALAPYLEALGARHGLDPLDARVVEAYWIGNDLLEGFDRSDFERLLDRLTTRGLPRSIARRLREHLPSHPLAHHAFHTSFVGVGAVTGHVPTTLPNLEECRPALARVSAVEERSLVVERPRLEVHDGRLVLGPARSERVPREPELLPEVAPGDAVALHWGLVATVLSPGQARRLAEYSERSWRAANEALPGWGILANA
jgi:hypothetical protein